MNITIFRVPREHCYHGWGLLIPSGVNMEGSEGTFRAGGICARGEYARMEYARRWNIPRGPKIQGAPLGSRAPGQFGKGNILIPSGINMEGSEGTFRAGGICAWAEYSARA